VSRDRRHLVGTPSAPWATGFARFWIDRRSGGASLSVAVRCRLGQLTPTEVALLDTGSTWSVIGGETALLAAPFLGDAGPVLELSTRLGSFDGRTHRLSISLLADEGPDLEIDASVLVAPAWSGPVVLGYRGFLERVRFALDPGVGEDDQWLSFGDAGA